MFYLILLCNLSFLIFLYVLIFPYLSIISFFLNICWYVLVFISFILSFLFIPRIDYKNTSIYATKKNSKFYYLHDFFVDIYFCVRYNKYTISDVFSFLILIIIFYPIKFLMIFFLLMLNMFIVINFTKLLTLYIKKDGCFIRQPLKFLQFFDNLGFLIIYSLFNKKTSKKLSLNFLYLRLLFLNQILLNLLYTFFFEINLIFKTVHWGHKYKIVYPYIFLSLLTTNLKILFLDYLSALNNYVSQKKIYWKDDYLYFNPNPNLDYFYKKHPNFITDATWSLIQTYAAEKQIETSTIATFKYSSELYQAKLKNINHLVQRIHPIGIDNYLCISYSSRSYLQNKLAKIASRKGFEVYGSNYEEHFDLIKPKYTHLISIPQTSLEIINDKSKITNIIQYYSNYPEGTKIFLEVQNYYSHFWHLRNNFNQHDLMLPLSDSLPANAITFHDFKGRPVDSYVSAKIEKDKVETTLDNFRILGWKGEKAIKDYLRSLIGKTNLSNAEKKQLLQDTFTVVQSKIVKTTPTEFENHFTEYLSIKNSNSSQEYINWLEALRKNNII